MALGLGFVEIAILALLGALVLGGAVVAFFYLTAPPERDD